MKKTPSELYYLIDGQTYRAFESLEEMASHIEIHGAPLKYEVVKGVKLDVRVRVSIEGG